MSNYTYKIHCIKLCSWSSQAWANLTICKVYIQLTWTDVNPSTYVAFKNNNNNNNINLLGLKGEDIMDRHLLENKNFKGFQETDGEPLKEKRSYMREQKKVLSE